MARQTQLRPEFVQYIPETLEPGVLYVSRRYNTASHLCCCGCGLEVVTPLNPAKWQLKESNGAVSLTPSIGNWSFPCRSHYWVTDGTIEWAGELPDHVIAAVKSRDRRDAERLAGTEQQGFFARLRRSAAKAWAALLRFLSGRS